MTDTVLISVIIPFYKNKKWLSEALESVYTQSYKNYEIILVNDGSDEDISQLLEKYNSKLKYIYKANSGPGDTRNVGIEKSNGEYLAFLDSDDIWLPNKLKDQLEFMLENKFVWSHTAGYYFWEKSGKKTAFDFHRNSGNVSKRGFLSMKIATPSVMVKSNIIKHNMRFRFNSKMRYSQDYPLFISLAQQYDLGYLDKKSVLVRVREKTNGISTNTALRIRLRFIGRSNMLNLYKMDKDFFYGRDKYNWIIHISHLYYFQINKYLIFLERFFSENTVEIFSKAFYIIPFTFERIYISLIDIKKSNFNE